MRVLAVDPGLTRCGFAVVDVESTRRVSLVAADVIRTPKEAPLGDRLLTIEEGLVALIALHHPTHVAVEQVFSQHNVQTVIGTAQAAGVAALVGARSGLPLTFHTPSEVKAAVTGSGRADKAQVAAMVSRIVGRPLTGPADLTDAVALGICHGWRFPSQSRLKAAAAPSPRREVGTGGARSIVEVKS